MQSPTGTGPIRSGRALESRLASGINLIQAGAPLFLVTGLMSTLGEGGDCGGSEATCQAASIASQTRLRVLTAVVVAMVGLAVVAWRARRSIFQASLLTASSLVLVVGFASFVVRASMPEWMPILIGFTVPGSAILAVGAYRRLRFTRVIHRR